MRLSDALGYKIIKKSKARIYTIGAIITGILSIMVGTVTFYGQNTGNFVMTLDQEAANRGIQLSEQGYELDELGLIKRNDQGVPIISNPTSRLMTDPVREARDITYAWLKIDQIINTNGQYNDPDHRYVAYTFYLFNTGLETVDITYLIRISDVTKNMDEAIRILVIEDDVMFRMYQKADQPKSDGSQHDYFQLPPGINFLEDAVFRERIVDFKPGDFKKFSIVIWLEGQDPDTTEQIQGGSIRANMIFRISTDKDDGFFA